jgi:dienelactone hydrolase
MSLSRVVGGCTSLAGLSLALVLIPQSEAQAPAAKAGDEMIEKYLAKETAKLGERVLDGAKTRFEWEARRPRLKEEYLYMLGLWPLPERTPLQAKVTGTLEREDFIVEKLHFQSRPGLYVTGNLYRPKKAAGKLPAVLYVCGHSGRGRNGNKTAFQDHGMWFASNGYVCLVIDTLQLGEIPGIHHGTYGRPYNHFKAYGIKDKDVVENRWWWQAAGYTPAGVECWNGVRAIDYLVSRPDVDAERIAVTGISGGGAATFWIAAADERVKCAVPVSGMSDLESYVTNKVINGHCDCMFLINTYQWEWTTIAALVAPRPLLFANSDDDRIFPMDGNRRIIARLRKLYQMYDKPELVDDYVSKGGHDYRPDLRIAIFKWINKHIKNDTGPVKDSADFKPFANEELRVFPEDKDIPKDAINGKIDETFVPRAQVKLPEEGKFAEWKKGLMKEIREKSFRRFPERIPSRQAGGRAASAGGGN